MAEILDTTNYDLVITGRWVESVMGSTEPVMVYEMRGDRPCLDRHAVTHLSAEMVQDAYVDVIAMAASRLAGNLL
ncbi:hypothetical protein LCGC14_2622190, partial [marine sediment metagenome]